MVNDPAKESTEDEAPVETQDEDVEDGEDMTEGE